jgi:hypothetical protein
LVDSLFFPEIKLGTSQIFKAYGQWLSLPRLWLWSPYLVMGLCAYFRSPVNRSFVLWSLAKRWTMAHSPTANFIDSRLL